MKSWSGRFESFYANVNYAYARYASEDGIGIRESRYGLTIVNSPEVVRSFIQSTSRKRTRRDETLRRFARTMCFEHRSRISRGIILVGSRRPW